MPAPTIRFLALVMRAAMVASGTRNSRAMSAVGTPSTSCTLLVAFEVRADRRQRAACERVLDRGTCMS